MKVDFRKTALFFSIAIAIGMLFFETHLITVTGSVLVIPFALFVSLALLLVSMGSRLSIRIRLRLPAFFACWIPLCIFFAYGLLQSEFLVVGKFFFFVIYALLLAKTENWINVFGGIVCFFSSISVFSTFFFYFFPETYSVLVDFFGHYPPGTGSLAQGYHAGIFGHFSVNAISTAVFIVVMLCKLSVSEGDIQKKKHRILYSIMLSLAVVALLMIGKRGTTVWCFFAALLTWFVGYRNKTKRIVRAVQLAVALVIGIQVASIVNPDFNTVLNRFAALGKDAGSQERLAMWNLAWEGFLEAPVLGIGFTNFRNLYWQRLSYLFFQSDMPESYQKLDAHNVYLQMFCETGVIGGVLYLLAVGLMLFATVKLIRYFSRSENREYQFGARCSFGIQVFYLTYSLTGNCLYDCVFYLYGFAIALTLTLIFAKKDLANGNESHEESGNSYLS